MDGKRLPAWQLPFGKYTAKGQLALYSPGWLHAAADSLGGGVSPVWVPQSDTYSRHQSLWLAARSLGARKSTGVLALASTINTRVVSRFGLWAVLNLFVSRGDLGSSSCLLVPSWLIPAGGAAAGMLVLGHRRLRRRRSVRPARLP